MAKQGNAQHHKGNAKMIGPYRNFKTHYQGESQYARILREVRSKLTLFFLTQDISDAKQVFRRPEMNVVFFCHPRICFELVPKK